MTKMTMVGGMIMGLSGLGLLMLGHPGWAAVVGALMVVAGFLLRPR